MRRQSLAPIVVVPLMLAPHVGDGHGPPRGRLAVIASASLEGSLRSGAPCHHPYGGLAHRADFYRELRATHGTSITVDAGDFVYPAHAALQGDLRGEALMMARTMGRLGYDAWTPGEHELGFGLDRLLEFDEGMGHTAVSANVRNAAGQPIFKPWRIQTVDGVRIGITGITDPTLVPSGELPEFNASTRRVIRQDYVLADPATALARVVEAIRSEVDVLVVLAHATPSRASALVDSAPGIDLVLAGHVESLEGFEASNYPSLVTFQPDRMTGYRVLVDLDAINRPGEMTVSATRLGSCAGPFERGDSTIAAAIEDFDRREAARSRREARARSEDATIGSHRYLGAEVCGRCHADVEANWAHGAHARAFEPLVQAGRERDESCLPCHVTAWEEPGGFTRLTIDDLKLAREDDPGARPHLAGVQCEACHGQGTGHGTRRMVTQVSEDACRTCHDTANDPDFDYAKALSGGFHHQ